MRTCSLHNLNIPVVVSGLGAVRRVKQFQSAFPALASRIIAAGFTDAELLLAYRYATAVIIPSIIEGFGLPVVEVIAAGGLPFVADCRGLREAGAEAAPIFSINHCSDLCSLISLATDASSRAWLLSRLSSRYKSRLSRLNPDLFGLCFLSLCRSISTF